jgi:hypothetical protein
LINKGDMVMRKILPLILFASLLGVSQVADARGGGGPGGGGPSGSAPGAGNGAPHFSGPSPNSEAAANSNGRFATDRDKGLDRAEDRMSAQGKAHEKATVATKKAKSKVPDADDVVRR